MKHQFFHDDTISDIILIQTTNYSDSRGVLGELYNVNIFSSIIPQIIQTKYAFSHYGVLRGLHFQTQPYEQGKLIKCLSGSIFDIAVDVRKKSPTFGKWVGHILSETNGLSMYVPPGFAHGVLSISKNGSLFHYATTNDYAPNHETGLLWSDPKLNIILPIPHAQVILSDKDKELPNLDQI